MKKIIIFTAIITSALIFYLNADTLKAGVEFPEIEGLKKDGKPDIYYPDTLFEYIDGAADQFLDYEFQVLYSQKYRGEKGEDVTVDIYRHADSNYAFGIYSQEKPESGSFMNTGTQGYWEEGVLNFYKGAYYVKIAAFDLGKKEKETLTSLADKIDSVLKGTTRMPGEFSMFPLPGKIYNSEQFVSKNFLGYPFFRSVFLCRYEIGKKRFRVFLIGSKNRKEQEKMISSYTNYLNKKGVSVAISGDYYKFDDPNYKREGKVIIKKCGNFLAGTISNEQNALLIVKKLSKNITKKDK